DDLGEQGKRGRRACPGDQLPVSADRELERVETANGPVGRQGGEGRQEFACIRVARQGRDENLYRPEHQAPPPSRRQISSYSLCVRTPFSRRSASASSCRDRSSSDGAGGG